MAYFQSKTLALIGEDCALNAMIQLNALSSKLTIIPELRRSSRVAAAGCGFFAARYDAFGRFFGQIRAE
jgi:hypothetical protein